MEKNKKKIKEIINKYGEALGNLTIILGIIAAVLIMIFVDLRFQTLDYISHKSNRDEVQVIHDFTTGMELRQTFSCYDNFDFITMSFSDHDVRLPGKVIIEIYEQENKKLLVREEIESSSIFYNVPVKISLEDVGGGLKEKSYEIVLMSEGMEEKGLGIFGYKADGENAIINGQKSIYKMSLGIHSYTDLYKNLVVVFFLVGIVAIMLVFAESVWFKHGEHYIFLMLAIPFVTCMMIIWPGNNVYDEVRHYNTVYYYSNKFLACGENDTYTEIMMRVCDTKDKEVYKDNVCINAQAQKWGYEIQRILKRNSDNDLVKVDISNAPIVSDGIFLQYLPGTIGMCLGRMLDLNFYWTMTITRIFIAGFYLFMCFYAIKKIPILKMMVVFVSTLPMNLYQASGISYDSFTYAVGIVVFAFIIKLWKDGMDKKEWVEFIIAVFLLGTCKGGVYLSIILLLCFIPKEHYIRNKWVKISGIIGIAGVSMISSYFQTILRWFINTPETPQASVVINSGGIIAEKLHPFYILESPIGFIKMFIFTMIENLDVYLGQMLGYRTAWSNEAIELVVMLPFLLLLILSVTQEEYDNFEISLPIKIGIFFILLVELVGMQAIFLTETPVYSDVIIGFQGRYFILFIPCILLMFRNKDLIIKENRKHLYLYFSMAQFVYLYFFLRIFMQA